MESSDAVLVLTTLPGSADTEAFGRALVDERLAACVSVLDGIRSVYRWEGDVVCDTERQVLIKTTAARVSALGERFRSLHPYTVPEFLVLPVADGGAAYLAWVRQSVSP